MPANDCANSGRAELIRRSGKCAVANLTRKEEIVNKRSGRCLGKYARSPLQSVPQ